MTLDWLGKTLLAAPKCTFHIITKWAGLCKVEIWIAHVVGRADRQVGSHEDLAKSSQGVSQPNEWHFIDGRQSGQFNCRRRRQKAKSSVFGGGDGAGGWGFGCDWGFHLSPGYWQALPRVWRHNHKIPKFNKHFHRIFGIANRWLTRFTAFCIGVSSYTLAEGILILTVILQSLLFNQFGSFRLSSLMLVVQKEGMVMLY